MDQSLKVFICFWLQWYHLILKQNPLVNLPYSNLEFIQDHPLFLQEYISRLLEFITQSVSEANFQQVDFNKDQWMVRSKTLLHLKQIHLPQAFLFCHLKFWYFLSIIHAHLLIQILTSLLTLIFAKSNQFDRLICFSHY